MMNIIATCLFGVTIHAEPVKSVPLMSTEAPKAYRLGAGDGLGRAVFDNYKSVVRANRHERERVVQSDWSIGVRLGYRVVRIDCVGGEHRVVHERVMLDDADGARGSVF